MFALSFHIQDDDSAGWEVGGFAKGVAALHNSIFHAEFTAREGGLCRHFRAFLQMEVGSAIGEHSGVEADALPPLVIPLTVH